MYIKSHKITNGWQNSKDSLNENPYFLAHEREPIDNLRSFPPDEVKQELFENRFFLKRRVWRNMRKIRRHPQIHYRVSGSELKILKPHPTK